MSFGFPSLDVVSSELASSRQLGESGRSAPRCSLGEGRGRRLQEAARASLERIRADCGLACAKIRPLLDHLSQHLFDPDLNVSQLKRACGVRDNSIATLFNATVGIPPATYIADRRFETASNLLRDTRLPVWKIGKLVGYSSMQSFSRAFARWSGQRPNAFRKAVAGLGRRRSELAEESSAARPVSWTAGRPAVLASRKAILASEGADRDSVSDAGLSPEGIESIKVEETWKVLQALPWGERRRLVARRLSPESPALFHHIRRMSRVIGRQDRREGVRIARLAIESLRSMRDPLRGEGYGELLAQGWIWLGNAQRLALEFSEAERSLDLAEGYLPSKSLETVVGAELFSIKASLRFTQHRMGEALSLQNRAVPIFRALGDSRALSSGLLLRGVIRHNLDDFRGAVQDSLEALANLDRKNEHFLALSAYLTLSLSHLGLKDHAAAEAVLPKARELSLRLKSDLTEAHVLWVEGRVCEAFGRDGEAASRYLEARSLFLGLEEGVHAAIVSLDLALLYARQGRAAEVLTLAMQTLPVLAVADFRSESVLAIKMLRDAIDSRRLPAELLREVRFRMASLGRDPSIPVPKGT